MWLFLYACVVAVSAVYNGQHSRGAFILPFLVIAVAGTPLGLDALLKAIRGICFVVNGLSLYWMYAHLEGAFFLANGRTLLGFQQVAGVTPHPNVLGPIAALGIGVELARHGRPVALLLDVVPRLPSRHARWLNRTTAGRLLGILTLTWFLRRRVGRSGEKRGNPRRGRQALVVVALAWIVAEHRSGKLALEDWNTLLNGRQQVWSLAIQPFYAHPVLGGGPGVYGAGFLIKRTAAWARSLARPTIRPSSRWPKWV